MRHHWNCWELVGTINKIEWMRKQNLVKRWSELKHAMENSFPYLEKEKKKKFWICDTILLRKMYVLNALKKD